MVKIKKILVPLDGSETSKEALRYAEQLAQQFQATMTLFTVADDQYMDWMGQAYFTNEMMMQIEENSKEQVRKILDELELSVPDVKTKKVVRKGHPVSEIIEFAKDQQIDMIVMGTHGRKGFPQMMMGSVAEKVVRLASCPVLTVKKDE